MRRLFHQNIIIRETILYRNKKILAKEGSLRGMGFQLSRELSPNPRKLGEKTRGRVSNVDFFLFSMKRKANEAWSRLSILKRNVSKLCRGNRVFHIPILSLLKILYIYIYFVSSIHSNCRLLTNLPLWIRLNLDKFINFVSAMREGKSSFIWLHKNFAQDSNRKM